MERFFKALDVAFREGCGLSLQTGGSFFQRRLREYREACGDRDLEIAKSVGVHRFAELLNEYSEAEALEIAGKESRRFRYGQREQRVEVALQILGEAIIEKAKEKIEPFIAALHAEHGDWNSATTSERKFMLRRLIEEISLSDAINVDFYQDRLNQPRGRALPGVFSLEDEVRPNCLGKAQLVAAFAAANNIEAYLVTPLTTFRQHLSQIRFNLVCELQEWISYREGPQNVFEATYRAIRLARRTEEGSRNYPHFGVVMRLSEKRWMLVDPNFAIVEDVGHRWDFAAQAASLTKYRDVLPGLAQVVEQEKRGDLWYADRHYQDFVAAASALEKLERKALVQSEDGMHRDLERWVTEVSESPEFKFLYRKSPLKNDLLGDTPRVRLLEYIKQLQGTESLTQSHLSIGLEILPEMMLMLGIETVSREITRRFRQTYVAVEVKNLAFGLAVATVSHVGVDLGFEESVEPQLYRVTSDIYRRLNIANQPLRGKGQNILSREAQAALRRMPFPMAAASHHLKR